MAIVKSEITNNTLQAHGQSYVIEKHTDHLGREHLYSYAAVDPNVNKIMANRVTHVNSVLEQMEIHEAIHRIENGEKDFDLEFTNWADVKLAAIEKESKHTIEIADLTAKKTELGKVE